MRSIWRAYRVVFFPIIKLRLVIAAIYILPLLTAWREWNAVHQRLSEILFFLIVALTAAIWVLMFVRFPRNR